MLALGILVICLTPLSTIGLPTPPSGGDASKGGPSGAPPSAPPPAPPPADAGGAGGPFGGAGGGLNALMQSAVAKMPSLQQAMAVGSVYGVGGGALVAIVAVGVYLKKKGHLEKAEEAFKGKLAENDITIPSVPEDLKKLGKKAQELKGMATNKVQETVMGTGLLQKAHETGLLEKAASAGLLSPAQTAMLMGSLAGPPTESAGGVPTESAGGVPTVSTGGDQTGSTGGGKPGQSAGKGPPGLGGNPADGPTGGSETVPTMGSS